eukprot:9969303-Alexandrium_andersonii.AAC.1
MGELALALAGARVCRCLWMVRGWPTRMVGVLGDDALCSATLSSFRADLEAWQALEQIEDPDSMLSSLKT